MDKNIELEYKILLTKEQFYTLLKKYNSIQFNTQINIYYDTLDHDIENKKGAMRIRTKNNKHIFTLKMHSKEGLLEYECEVEGNNLEYLDNPKILSLLNQYDIHPPFYKTAELKTERAIYKNEFAELCFDINYYNDTIDYEIEYEYSKAHDGMKVFNEILSEINIVYSSNCKSKIQRALNR